MGLSMCSSTLTLGHLLNLLNFSSKTKKNKSSKSVEPLASGDNPRPSALRIVFFYFLPLGRLAPYFEDRKSVV